MHDEILYRIKAFCHEHCHFETIKPLDTCLRTRSISDNSLQFYNYHLSKSMHSDSYINNVSPPAKMSNIVVYVMWLDPRYAGRTSQSFSDGIERAYHLLYEIYVFLSHGDNQIIERIVIILTAWWNIIKSKSFLSWALSFWDN